MECLRYAGCEFDGKFLGAVEQLEAACELSVDEFVGGLAESLNPGSTVDLGKFFTTALATLDRPHLRGAVVAEPAQLWRISGAACY